MSKIRLLRQQVKSVQTRRVRNSSVSAIMYYGHFLEDWFHYEGTTASLG